MRFNRRHHPEIHLTRARSHLQPASLYVRALSVSSRPQGTATENSAQTPSMGPQWLPSWHLLIVAAWLAGCLIGLGRLARAWLRMREGLGRARPIRAGRIYQDAAELAARAGIRCPHLTQLDELASPIAADGRRIVLPDWVFEQFDPAQMRAMLAHEIAHLARRDPLSKARGCRRLCTALVHATRFACASPARRDRRTELRCVGSEPAWQQPRDGRMPGQMRRAPVAGRRVRAGDEHGRIAIRHCCSESITCWKEQP